MIGTEKDLFAAQYERFAQRPSLNGDRWQQRLRSEGYERFRSLGFPTVRMEEWKYTNLAPMARIPFEAAPAVDFSVASLRQLPYGFWTALRLVFVNGRLAPHLSMLDGLPAGVRLMGVAEALQRHSADLESYLSRRPPTAQSALVALNTALLEDGAFLHLPRGTALEQPIRLLYVTVPGEGPIACHPRNVIVAEAGSRATVLETYCAVGEGTYLTNAVTDLFVEEGAAVEHYKVQMEGAAAYHIAATEFHAAANSSLDSCFISYGGALVRNDIDSIMQAEGVSTTLNGLYLASGKQHVDCDTLIDHRSPHCQSAQSYKGILRDQAEGVFSGTVHVQPNAQKSEAHQYNKNLLLSDKAVVDTRPQLQIYADDVKCTHGVAVGALNEDELFYLRSRGLDVEAASNLLIYAFASEIIDKVRIDTVRHDLRHILTRGVWGGLGLWSIPTQHQMEGGPEE